MYSNQIPAQFFDENYCITLYSNSEEFDKLSKSQQAFILAQHPTILKKCLEENRWQHLRDEISGIITCYIINVAPFKDNTNRTSNPFPPHHATEEARQAICFQIFTNQMLMEVLNPAAKILLLAYLKKSSLWQSCVNNNDFKTLELAPQLLEQIRQAYDIRTDYSEDKDNWNLWPTLAGLNTEIQINNGSLHNLWFAVQCERDNLGPCSKSEVDALAEVLLTHPIFQADAPDDGFARIFNGTRDARGLAWKYDEEVTHISSRFKLGMKFKHCAELMLHNKRYQGFPGEITEDDLSLMTKQHQLSTVHTQAPVLVSLASNNAHDEIGMAHRLQEVQRALMQSQEAQSQDIRVDNASVTGEVGAPEVLRLASPAPIVSARPAAAIASEPLSHPRTRNLNNAGGIRLHSSRPVRREICSI